MIVAAANRRKSILWTEPLNDEDVMMPESREIVGTMPTPGNQT